LEQAWESKLKVKSLRTLSYVILFVSLTFHLFAGADSLTGITTQGIERTKYLLLMHEEHMQELSTVELSSPSKYIDIGNIAVITGNRKTFFPRNPFDLTGRKISFIPNGSGGYDVKVSSGTISGDEGVSLGPVPIRSKKVAFKSGFSFPFYGVNYSSVFVDGCGSLGFQKAGFPSGDPLAALGGPPVIVPLEASCAEQVNALQTPDKFAIT
jgi:hypothetical protein